MKTELNAHRIKVKPFSYPSQNGKYNACRTVIKVMVRTHTNSNGIEIPIKLFH
jgi:hypothetical protein